MYVYNDHEIEIFSDERGVWVLFNDYVAAIGGAHNSGAGHISYYRGNYGVEVITDQFRSKRTNRLNIFIRVDELHKLFFGKINMRQQHAILQKQLERTYMAQGRIEEATSLPTEKSLTGTPQSLPNEKDIRIKHLEQQLQQTVETVHKKAERINELEKQLAEKTTNSHHVPLAEALRREGFDMSVFQRS